jgi:hypothetical protein
LYSTVYVHGCFTEDKRAARGFRYLRMGILIYIIYSTIDGFALVPKPLDMASNCVGIVAHLFRLARTIFRFFVTFLEAGVRKERFALLTKGKPNHGRSVE